MSRQVSNKYTRLERDLRKLKIFDTLSHSVNLEMRQYAYNAARKLGITICVLQSLTKKGRFEITRIE